MQSQEKLKHHAGLVDRMATAMGVDLEEELFRGALSPSDVPDAVLRCSACADPGHCDAWLNSRRAVASKTPGYCRNADLMASLRETKAARV